MSIHQDWSTAAFEQAPLAPHVGPFPLRNWLRTWWDHRGVGELVIAEADGALIVLTMNGTRLEFAGEPDLTDYHTPLGADPAGALGEVVAALDPGTQIRLDSLPHEAADEAAAALASCGLHPTTNQHAITAVLTLPESFDEYMHQIGKKERHEMRRKRRRFEGELGPATVERWSGAKAVSLFADLHRRASGDKGAFMTPEIEAFFHALHNHAGGVIDVLLDGSGQPASAVFSFEDENEFYLYNSAFRPEIRHLSPGNVMLSLLIERSIERNTVIFDFLKGDETYKFRLGAEERPLFRVEATIGGAG